MNGWMDGWMDGWVDGWMVGWVHVWMDDRIHGRMNEWMTSGMDRYMDTWIYGYMNISIDRYLGDLWILADTQCDLYDCKAKEEKKDNEKQAKKEDQHRGTLHYPLGLSIVRYREYRPPFRRGYSDKKKRLKTKTKGK